MPWICHGSPCWTFGAAELARLRCANLGQCAPTSWCSSYTPSRPAEPVDMWKGSSEVWTPEAWRKKRPERCGAKTVGLFGGRISRISTLIRPLLRSFGPQNLRDVLGWLPSNRVCTGQSHGHKQLPGAHVHRIHHIDFECGFDSSGRSKPCSPETRQPKRRSPR